MKKLCITAFAAIIAVCICFSVWSVPTAYAQATFYSADDFDVYAPVGSQNKTYFTADITTPCDEMLLEKCFSIVTKGELNEASSLTYSDGDDYRTSYRAASDDDGFYVYLRYNETYTLVFTIGDEQYTRTMDLSNRGFDFKAPRITSVGLISEDNTVAIKVTDNLTGSRHISAKSGIKSIRFYSDTHKVDEYTEYDGRLSVNYVARGVTRSNGSIFYLEVTDMAGNATIETIYSFNSTSWTTEYTEKLSVIDGYLEWTSDGVGLSYDILESLEDVRLRYVESVTESGDPTLISEQLKSDWSTAVSRARAATLTSLNRTVESDIPDGLRLQYLESTAYYTDIRYGDEVSVKVEKTFYTTDEYYRATSTADFPRSKVDGVVTYTLTVFRNGKEESPDVAIVVYDDSSEVFETTSVRTEGACVRIRFLGNSTVTAYLKKTSSAPLTTVVCLWAGLLSALLAYLTIALIVTKRK